MGSADKTAQLLPNKQLQRAGVVSKAHSDVIRHAKALSPGRRVYELYNTGIRRSGCIASGRGEWIAPPIWVIQESPHPRRLVSARH